MARQVSVERMDEPDFTGDPGGSSGSAGMELIRSGAQLVRVENEMLQSIAQLRPRDEVKILEAALREIELVPEESDRYYYVIPYKDHKMGCADRRNCNCPETKVEGQSVVAARALIRRWGNCSVSSGRVVDENDREISIEGVAIDLETGFRKSRIAAVSKWGYKKGGGAYKLSDDKVAKAIAIQSGKLERNVSLDLLPPFIKAATYKKARAVAAGGASWNAAKWGKVIAVAFGKVGITSEQLEARLKHSLSEITQEEYSDLVGIGNAIRDGQVEAAEVFGGVALTEDAAPPTAEEKLGSALDGAETHAEPQGASTRETSDRETVLTKILEASTILGRARFDKVLAEHGIKAAQLGACKLPALQALLAALHTSADASD